tara:strand:+ start:77453 stop:78040 length:588 start_codon:yes stop_codon:yes gene_type:complete
MDIREIIFQWVPKNSRVLDLGCGEGEILEFLVKNKNVKQVGIEIDTEKIESCISKGLNVVEQDIDKGLENFSNSSFDAVIMTQTIQVLQQPSTALSEVTRIGKFAIVTIPNFGHWVSRFQLLLTGKMPKTSTLPESWHATSNIHLCSIADFEDLCNELSINIEEKIYFNSKGVNSFFLKSFPNLFCASAVFKISK